MNPPNHIGFILSRRCTARCRICYVRNELEISRGARRGDSLPLFGSEHMPTGDMDPVKFEAILAAYPSVTAIDLASIGETFDYTYFDDVFARAVRYMPRVKTIGVTSNGKRLDEHMHILQYPGYITISVDSPDPGRCDYLRPGTDGERVWRNITAAMRSKAPSRNVSTNMIVSKSNAHEVGSMADRLAGLGVNSLVVLRALHLSGETADDVMAFNEGSVRASILAARARHPWMAIGDHFTYFDGGLTTAPPGGCCPIPFEQVLVDQNGHARLCCRIQGVDAGDMLTDNPWGSAAFESLRAQVLTGGMVGPFDACRVCTVRNGAGTAHLT